MKYIAAFFIMGLLSSCVHPERIGGKASELSPHKTGREIVQMELRFSDMNTALTYCSITLFRNSKDWSLCYVEYDNNTLNHHRHIELKESEGDEIFQNSIALFTKSTNSIDRKYSLTVSMTLSDYIPIINEYDQIELEVWEYNQDLEGVPEWEEFLNRFKHEFPEFDKLIGEISNYKHKYTRGNEPLFPE